MQALSFNNSQPSPWSMPTGLTPLALQQWFLAQKGQPQSTPAQFTPDFSQFNAFNRITNDMFTSSSPLQLSLSGPVTPASTLGPDITRDQVQLPTNSPSNPSDNLFTALPDNNTENPLAAIGSLLASPSGNSGSGLTLVLQQLLQFAGTLPSLLAQKKQNEANEATDAKIQAKKARAAIEKRIEKLEKENDSLRSQIKELKAKHERERMEAEQQQKSPPPSDSGVEPPDTTSSPTGPLDLRGQSSGEFILAIRSAMGYTDGNYNNGFDVNDLNKAISSGKLTPSQQAAAEDLRRRSPNGFANGRYSVTDINTLCGVQTVVPPTQQPPPPPPPPPPPVIHQSDFEAKFRNFSGFIREVRKRAGVNVGQLYIDLNDLNAAKAKTTDAMELAIINDVIKNYDAINTGGGRIYAALLDDYYSG